MFLSIWSRKAQKDLVFAFSFLVHHMRVKLVSSLLTTSPCSRLLYAPECQAPGQSQRTFASISGAFDSKSRFSLKPLKNFAGCHRAKHSIMSNSMFDDIDDSALLAMELPDSNPCQSAEIDSYNIQTVNKHIKTEHPQPKSTLESRYIEDGFDQELRSTLERYYGYSAFRPGQLKVLRAILLEKRDVSVFWATGRGKSLCYQIPALQSHLVSLVISPLVSLMQDQCHKLNSLSDRPFATYLGSSQSDDSMDQRALVLGEFKIVYVTPEKLLSGNTLAKVSDLHATRGLCCIAIDEAHCVSEWGHDFRPEYRQLHKIRETFGLKGVPIVTLTATAVPRVQDDITKQLRLHSPFVDVQSFDRPNLRLKVRRKPTGSGSGYAKALKPLVDLFSSIETQSLVSSFPSTIIYVPTKSQVDELSSWLTRELQSVAPRARVASYHASHTSRHREEVHTSFLVGNTHVIVATIAFGMGIDKPDIRHVIHYGPPKCMEAYLQQIGRAGRDGLTSECCMFCNDADFNRLFTHEDGNSQNSASVLESTKALHKFANDHVSCRRASLLQYLQQDPPFGDRCGTCDNCLNFKRFNYDLERDMAKEARVILRALSGLTPKQPMSFIEKLLKGSTSGMDDWRFKQGITAESLKNQIETTKRFVPTRHKSQIMLYKELIPLLAERGYIEQARQKGGGQYKMVRS